MPVYWLRCLSSSSHDIERFNNATQDDPHCPSVMTYRVALLGLLFAFFHSTATPAELIVDRGATWRWRRGTTEASTPVASWRLRGFNDADFVQAPSPFWFDTAGDSSTLSGGTRIQGMQGVYGCLFLRKTFVVTNLAKIAALRLGSLADDGFVAWINGTEVLRVRVPGATGDPVSITTLANNAPEPVAFVTNNLPTPPSYLVLGTNLLAVQVFQSSLGSSDFGFNASLEAVLAETNSPTVVTVTPKPGTLTELTQVTVRFDEPVTGVTAAHLLINGVGATGVTALNSATYLFQFDQPRYGDVAFRWSPIHQIADQSIPPNRFDESGPGATWFYTLVDTAPPFVAGLTPAASRTLRSLNTITVRFSEPVSGVSHEDLLINGKPASGVTAAAPSEYLFDVAQPATGLVQVAWAVGHNIRDLAASPNAFAGGNWTYRLDPSAADPGPYISEFMASNTRTLADETGAYSDWIEIYNPSASAVNLDGWFLTDSARNLTKWRFPATNLASGRFLVVFASGHNRRIAGAPLHTSFELSASGEFLGLVKPDGVTIATEFNPAFPQQVLDVSYGFAQSDSGPEYTTSPEGVYLTTPTPRAVNLGGKTLPGPVIEAVHHVPNVPLDDQDLQVTARVRPSFHPVDRVTMRYRIQFNDEVTTLMWDDGAHGDGEAGDGIYGATIARDVSAEGQMIRYLVSATDVSGNASRWPLFTSPTQTEEYLGTMVEPSNLTSQLPIFHLFVAPDQLSKIDSESGGRLAFFYDGEFYDNVYMELRGNTSAGLAKKAHRLEFNRGHELRHAGPGGRSRKSALLAEYLDPTYLRQHLSFWFLNQIGVPAPFNYPVHVRMNGQFYQLAFHSDVIGQEQVERLGYDPAGALYKAVGTLTPDFFSTGVFQKLEPDNIASRTDYLQLAQGINESGSMVSRRKSVFDLLDVPQVINHLAGTRWCSENDDVWANMSLYRDSFGDGLWRCIPFDMNASWGQLYGGSSPLQASIDSCKSHPLYGGSSIPACDGPSAPYNFNRLYDVIVALPETRQMLLRRQRSILDQMVQPPGTPADSLILENRIRFMTNLIGIEANLDRAKWGFSPWASGKTFHSGVSDLLNQFVGPRRRHWYLTHSITNTSRSVGIRAGNSAGIPLAQAPTIYLSILEAAFNPLGGNQEQEYLCITNHADVAVDVSGWKLEGGIDFTFAPGTVLPSNSVAYVSPNPRAFRSRTAGPRGGQGLLVLGPYQGQLSARGETIRVKNTLDQTLSTYSYPGAPSLAQQFLRVTELMYHPSGLEGNSLAPDEFEYIELRNVSPVVTLSLAGVRLTNGVDFNFSAGAISTLAPGARVLVVKNVNAFSTRYGAGAPVAGQYTGYLDNNGGRLRLLDSANEEILDFRYEDRWHPMTDGLGFSLTVVDDAASPDAWERKDQWRPSGTFGGSPSTADPSPAVIAPVVIQEALTRSDESPPFDTIELHNPTALPADISGWWLTDDFKTPAKFRIPNGTIILPGGDITFDERAFNVGDRRFGLDSDGDEVWLFSADRAGALTGYFHGYSFGPAENGVSFGRHIASDGRELFVAQSARTLGLPNVGPRASPVLIHELMYHPIESEGRETDRAGEYIELLNVTAGTVALFEGTNTWRLQGGVEFDFPTNTILLPEESVLLVAFNPTNTAILTEFRSKYGVKNTTRLFGPYSGRLNNSGDSLELQMPTTAAVGFVTFVVLEKVDYSDSAPWPGGADGFGLSLQRRSPAAFANDPASWVAAPPTVGLWTPSGGAPAITVQPLSLQLTAEQRPSFNVAAIGAEPLRFQWRFNGKPLPNATNSTLDSTSAQHLQAGDYDVLVFNSAGSALSSNATLTRYYPMRLLTQPQSVTARAGDQVTMNVVVHSGAMLAYQWRQDGRDLLGATNAFLLLTNVQPAASAAYDVLVSDVTGSIRSDSARLRVVVDLDDDGLPDDWEQFYFGANGTSADADSDGDGMSNGDEYRVGTDPTNSLSLLKVDSITRGNGVTLAFGAVSNRIYTIQFQEALDASSWTNLVELPARAINRVETIVDPSPSSSRFYRIATPPSP